ncbi:hypothetical protein QQS21_004841 [Conoideocrella luteorostrata]|uniref:Uncharacterized protein n=1 Tax=Conoideocrella luteorostrata TaxID=1105319 RepID=A0AAJ0FZI9_9HYPO|nr:hypothetical protein QQS21_004841 [Conoideocrella luteorostrata]
MQEASETTSTAKYSLAYRQMVLNRLYERYLKLERLRGRAMQFTTSPKTIFWVACDIELPEPSELEEKELEDEVTREDFPWLNELPYDFSFGIERDLQPLPEGNSGSDGWPRCETRVRLELDLNRCWVSLLSRSSQLGQPLPWTDTFPDKFEAFLDHLGKDCCVGVRDPSQGDAVGGPDDRPYTADGRRDMVTYMHLSQLGKDVEIASEAVDMMAAAIRRVLRATSCRKSRRSRFGRPNARASLLKSAGLGSLLVESSSSGDAEFTYDSWESWGSAARPTRSVLVGKDVQESSQAGIKW